MNILINILPWECISTNCEIYDEEWSSTNIHSLSKEIAAGKTNKMHSFHVYGTRKFVSKPRNIRNDTSNFNADYIFFTYVPPNKAPAMWSFYVFFVVSMNTPLTKQSSSWWIQTPWRHGNHISHPIISIEKSNGFNVEVNSRKSVIILVTLSNRYHSELFSLIVVIMVPISGRTYTYVWIIWKHECWLMVSFMHY